MRKFLTTFLILCLMPLATFASLTSLDKVVAIVNDGAITQSQLETATKIVTQEMMQANVPLPDNADLQRQVLEKLILEEIQIQYAYRTGLVFDDARLDELMSNIAQQNQMTLDNFRQAITEQGIDYKQFREQVKRNFIISQLQQRDVMQDVRVTPQELNYFLNTSEGQSHLGLEYNLNHILIELPESPSPEDVQQAKQHAMDVVKQLREGANFKNIALKEGRGQHALSGGDLGWRKIPEMPTLFVNVVPGLELNEISDPIRSPSGFHIIQLSDKRSAESNRQYIEQSLVRHVLIKTNAMLSDDGARTKLEYLRKEIESGEDFSEIAKTYSEDLASAKQGGSIGWVTGDALVPEFKSEIDKLSPNQISQPFKSPFGWHIAQVLDRKTEENTEVQQRLRAEEMIRARKIEEKLESWQRQLRDESYVQIRLNNSVNS